MSQLSNIVDVPNTQPRRLSASECRVYQHPDTVNTHRHDVAEAFSKRQQRRLRKQLKSMSIQSNLQANAEKAPRKRGSRGSKKETDEMLKNPQQHTVQPTKTVRSIKTDIAAKNLIRNKCSQINAKSQEKLSLCSTSIQAASSTSLNPSHDLVVESIEQVAESSSVTSDSSNFPTDEETTSLARSDEIESSCNEKRIGSTVETNLSGSIEGNVLKEHVTMVSLK